MENTNRHPIETPKKRELKDNKNMSLSKLLNVKLNVELRQHQPALLFVKDRRDYIPTLVEICECFTHFALVRYKCYDPQGNFRQYIYTGVSYIDLFTGNNKLKFFDDNI